MRRFARPLPAVPPAYAAVSRALPSAALCLLAAGCASGGSAPIEGATGTRPATVRVDGVTGQGSAQINLTHNDQATESDLPVPVDRAYAVLPLVYEQVGLKINTAASDTHTIGVNAASTRHVGKEPLSHYLSCGTNVTGTPLADSYAVTLAVLSRVTPSGAAGSLLSTQVLATAQPMSTSGTTVTCQSTGLLEERIAKAAALQTTQGAH